MTNTSSFVSSGMARAAAYWPKFSPRVFVRASDAEASFLFHGLFSLQHRWGSDYLVSLSDDELVLLMKAFDMKMSQLDFDERGMVIELASRRYSGLIDDAVQRLQLEARRLEVDNAEAAYEAKKFAVEEDAKRVGTAIQSLQNTIARTDLRIAELTSEIAVTEAETVSAGVEKALVEADVLQKQLAEAQALLEVQRATMRALQLQQDVVETELEVLKTGVRVSELGADKVQWDVRLAENEAQILELQASKKELETRQAQLASRKKSLEAEAAEHSASEADYATRLAQLASRKLALEAESAEQLAAKKDRENRLANLAAQQKSLEAEKEEHDYRASESSTRIVELEARKSQIDAEIDSIESRTKRIEAQTLTAKTMIDEIAVQIAQVEAETAGIGARIARTDVEIARLSLTESEAKIAEKEAEVENLRANSYWPARVLAAQQRAAAYTELLGDYQGLTPIEEALAEKLLESIDARHALQVNDLDIAHALHSIETQGEISTNTIYRDDAETNADNEVAVMTKEVGVIKAKKDSSKQVRKGAVEAAEIMAEAVITSNLTHSISGA